MQGAFRLIELVELCGREIGIGLTKCVWRTHHKANMHCRLNIKFWYVVNQFAVFDIAPIVYNVQMNLRVNPTNIRCMNNQLAWQIECHKIIIFLVWTNSHPFVWIHQTKNSVWLPVLCILQSIWLWKGPATEERLTLILDPEKLYTVYKSSP